MQYLHHLHLTRKKCPHCALKTIGTVKELLKLYYCCLSNKGNGIREEFWNSY